MSWLFSISTHSRNNYFKKENTKQKTCLAFWQCINNIVPNFKDKLLQ